jgi:hypothetical protein
MQATKKEVGDQPAAESCDHPAAESAVMSAAEGLLRLHRSSGKTCTELTLEWLSKPGSEPDPELQEMWIAVGLEPGTRPSYADKPVPYTPISPALTEYLISETYPPTNPSFLGFYTK